MIKNYENKAMTKQQKAALQDLLNVIDMHERALASARIKAEAATTQLEEYRKAQIQEQIEINRPKEDGPYKLVGQPVPAPFVFLDKDPDRDRLEANRLYLVSEVNRLEAKLKWLRTKQKQMLGQA